MRPHRIENGCQPVMFNDLCPISLEFRQLFETTASQALNVRIVLVPLHDANYLDNAFGTLVSCLVQTTQRLESGILICLD